MRTTLIILIGAIFSSFFHQTWAISAGSPQIKLSKTAGSVVPRGGNVFSVEWTVVLENTGDENNLELTSWVDDFQAANVASPMIIDFTKTKISSMTGTANGVAITMADANASWNGSSAQKNILAADLSTNPLLLDVGEKITVKFYTQFTLALSTTILNGTDATARWLNNGNYEPVPVVKDIKDAGGLPTALPQASVTKSLNCYTLNPTTNEHYLEYKIVVKNTGLIPISELSIQDDIKTGMQGSINVLSTEVAKSRVFTSTTGVSVSDSTRFGLGNNGVFTGWDSNIGSLTDTELLAAAGVTTPDLKVGESLELLVRFKVTIASPINANSVDWHQRKCVYLNNTTTANAPTGLLSQTSLPVNVCPVEAVKALQGNISILEIDPVLGNRYQSMWTINIYKSPQLRIDDISLKDNFEQSNASPEAIEVLTASVVTNPHVDSWDGETAYTSGDITTTANDYLINPNRGYDWTTITGTITNGTMLGSFGANSQYLAIGLTLPVTFRYLYGTDPSATNTVAPNLANICNNFTFTGTLPSCGGTGPFALTLTDEKCGSLPQPSPQASVTKSLNCYTLNPTTNEHYLEYKVVVKNTGLIPISELTLQDNLKTGMQGSINVLSTEVAKSRVFTSTTGVSVSDSTRFGLGNNGVFTGWDSNTGSLTDTELLAAAGVTTPDLKVGESLELLVRFKVTITSPINANSVDWHQRKCVYLNNTTTANAPTGLLSQSSISVNVCPVEAVKALQGNISILEIDPVLGNRYQSMWTINIYKSPQLRIDDVSLKDNFEQSNASPEAIEVLTASVVTNPHVDSWDGETAYTSGDIATTANDYLINPNRGYDWTTYASTITNGTMLGSFGANSQYLAISLTLPVTFRYLYGTDPSATNTVAPNLANICNNFTFTGTLPSCGGTGPFVLTLTDEKCGSLPQPSPQASVVKSLNCYTLNPTTNEHYLEYKIVVKNTGLIPISELTLQDNIKTGMQGSINVLSTEVAKSRVFTSTTGVSVSDSTRFGLGNNGVFTGWDSNTGSLTDTELLAAAGVTTPDLKVGESLELLVRFKVTIASPINANSVDWHQRKCVNLNNTITANAPTGLLSQGSIPVNVCPVEAVKALQGNISILEIDPILGNRYQSMWTINIYKSPQLRIDDISLKDNFEQSNASPEAIEVLTASVVTNPHVDSWDGETAYTSGDITTTANDYLINPNRGYDWTTYASTITNGTMLGSFGANSQYLAISLTLPVTFRYLYGTDPSATNTVAPANALIENEGRFTGIIKGCGIIPDQPLFLSAKASVSPINVTPPGNNFTKTINSVVCNTDGTVTATFNLKFINTSNTGGLTQNYTYNNFNFSENFAQIIASNSYPFTITGASVLSASKNASSQTVNSGFNANTNNTLFASSLTLAPNDTAKASVAITFNPNGFNPAEFFINEAAAQFDIQGFANSTTTVTALAGSTLGGACSLINIGISNQLCNNNGTLTLPSDDYVTFSLNPAGISSGTYTVLVNKGATVTPTTGTFGQVTNFRLSNGSANDSLYTITVLSDANNCCKITGTVQLPSCVSIPCPTITQAVDTTICVGKSITLRADLTDIATQDVKFVYFNTHQTDVAAIYGTPDGVLGTVTNAQLTSAKTKAVLTVTMPTASVLKTFHVYAILSPAPTDAACRPYGHRHVITDPALCPCVPQCLSVTVTKRKIP